MNRAHVYMKWLTKMADQLAKDGKKRKNPHHTSLLRHTHLSSLSYKESQLQQQNWRIQPKPGHTSSAASTPTDHHLSPQNRPLHTEKPSEKDWYLKTSAQCPCGEADQTPQHFLHYCSFCHQATPGSRYSPLVSSSKSKLCESAEDLFLTHKCAALMGQRM